MNFDLTESRSILQRTPRVLVAWLGGLEDAWVDCREGEGSWSPREVVAHLVHGEQTDWIPRVRHLLEHGASVPFTPFDRDAHVGAALPAIGDLLAEFAKLRAESLRTLDELLAGQPPLDSPGRTPTWAR